jgi:hypothetical protein
MRRFWNNFNQIRSKSKDWKVKSFKVVVSNKIKGPQQDIQKGSPVPEGDEL